MLHISSFFFFWLNHPVSGTTGAPTKSGFEPGRTTRAAKLSQPSFNAAACPRLEHETLVKLGQPLTN